MIVLENTDLRGNSKWYDTRGYVTLVARTLNPL